MHATLNELISRQRSGWSLEQPFYIAPEIYEIERAGWLARQWFVLGHRSELLDPGSYLVRELLGESILITRDSRGVIRGFYNVCRHRGSRICDKDGRGTSLVCPYHAWSYRLDGSVRAAPALPDTVNTAELGLKPVGVREIGGLILGSLSGDPVSLEVVEERFGPGMAYHGIPEARIAARRVYPTRGNWKLVLENFIECYHCLPSHPEYCSVMGHVDALAREAPDAGAAWAAKVEGWFKQGADPNSPLGSNRLDFSTDICAAVRGPIGGGRKTQSQDGRPVAPLMGRLLDFDGGVSTFRCEPFVFLAALNDHAVFFQFLPTGPESTDVSVTWLVNGSAGEAEVDVERMVWLWDVTTRQDKAIIERNAAGVRSRAYGPGPYSKLESWPARFVGRYLREMAAAGGK